jgi:hypothetical protein
MELPPAGEERHIGEIMVDIRADDLFMIVGTNLLSGSSRGLDKISFGGSTIREGGVAVGGV